MYLPRSLVGHLYSQLVLHHRPLSAPVLLLVAPEPDALCACRILTSLLRRDYIPHKVQPVGGYSELVAAGIDLVRPMRTTDGGSGGVVICLGVGGLVDLEEKLGLEQDPDGDPADDGMGGVEVWVIDARRPYNLTNVFGGMGFVSTADLDESRRARMAGIDKGRLSKAYRFGSGGIIVFDDGDIESDLTLEQEAYCALAEMPDLGADEDFDNDDDDEDEGSTKTGGGGGVDLTNPKEQDHRGLPPSNQLNRKRKTPESDDDDDDTLGFLRPPSNKRRAGSVSPVSSPRMDRSQYGLMVTDSMSGRQIAGMSLYGDDVATPAPAGISSRRLRRKLVRLRAKHDRQLQQYYSLGTSYAEPISSLVYSLASDLGREDNDLLWYAIVGCSSLEFTHQTSHGLSLPLVSASRSVASVWSQDRTSRVQAILRDEVRRLNPGFDADSDGAIITNSKTPTDNSIRLSPEPNLLLLRHWSLYDSMLHSPYLAAKLNVWNDGGKQKLHKLLAKMGISLTQSRQSYTHMDIDLKRSLRDRLLKFAPLYGLDEIVPSFESDQTAEGQNRWGFVRCWGWKACLSATDVAVTISSILDIGDTVEAKSGLASDTKSLMKRPELNHLATRSGQGSGVITPRSLDGSTYLSPPDESNQLPVSAPDSFSSIAADYSRFFVAYDALTVSNVAVVMSNIRTAQLLSRAILRTGKSLIEKRQIRKLRAFRMAVVKEGPDVRLFCRVGPLVKLAAWLGSVIRQLEGGDFHAIASGGEPSSRPAGLTGELVLAGLDEERDVFVVVGLGGGTTAFPTGSETNVRKRRLKKTNNRGGRTGDRNDDDDDDEANEKKGKGKLKTNKPGAGLIKELVDHDQSESESSQSDSTSDSDQDSDSSSDSDSDHSDQGKKSKKGKRLKRSFAAHARAAGRNRFGLAFIEVADETGARLRKDSFEHCVVEVPRDGLSVFLERLSVKAVIG